LGVYMKFVFHILPAYPASAEERERLAPIAHRTDKTQEMLQEMLEITQHCEDIGFDVVTFSEHHFYTEGCEAGATPTPHLIRLLLNTKRIKIGPLGFVLPTWDPIRLALDVAWADQMSKGRVICGLARGIFPRWVNVLGQHYGVEPGGVGASADEHNREVFEELYQVIKLAWREEPFSFKGKYYQVPFPAEGHPWAPHEATARYGAPGEVENGMLRKLSAVPKPYQKPHPDVWQAFTASDRTIRWDAREGIRPMVFAPFPDGSLKAFRAYQDEAAKAGRNLRLGEMLGACQFVYIGKDRAEAQRLMDRGSFFVYKNFHSKVDKNIPSKMETLLDLKMAVAGNVDDVRRRIADIQETLNPEYMLWLGDQGYLTCDEMKRELELFATKIIPEFRDRSERTVEPEASLAK
jgi:alkanesulfonate monooxygenase SsuD/methylene tetrahydromethanopterin reductase-like flavin-dependent oxidoreductase (luciferase family)